MLSLQPKSPNTGHKTPVRRRRRAQKTLCQNAPIRATNKIISQITRAVNVRRAAAVGTKGNERPQQPRSGRDITKDFGQRRGAKACKTSCSHGPDLKCLKKHKKLPETAVGTESRKSFEQPRPKKRKEPQKASGGPLRAARSKGFKPYGADKKLTPCRCCRGRPRSCGRPSP